MASSPIQAERIAEEFSLLRPAASYGAGTAPGWIGVVLPRSSRPMPQKNQKCSEKLGLFQQGNWWWSVTSRLKSLTFTPNYPWLSYSFIKAKTTNQRCVPAVPFLTATQPGSGAGIWLDGGAGVIDPWLLVCHCVPQICHRFAFLG